MEHKKKIRIPKQERSKETRQRILNAGLDLFSEKGFYKTNSKEIAKKAGVSTGSFYMYFADKRELFKAALIDYHKSINSVLEQLDIRGYIQSGSRKSFLKHLIQILIEAHNIYPEFHQEITAVTTSDPEFHAINEKSKKDDIKHAKKTLSAWKDYLRVKDLEAAAIILQTSVEEIVHTLVFSKYPVQEEKLIEELIDMLHRYLFKE